MLPLAFATALGATAWLPVSQANPRLFWSILGAALALLAAWAASLRRPLRLEVALRPQHYLQACAQLTVLLYWGYYWRPVYEHLPLLGAQLLFAYATDMLLSWWRRGVYSLGFGPFPVIFSINLFLWFKPDWFYLQFLMIALGFAAKELIRWERDGARRHIFNPSSFPLAVVSVVLILTGTTSMTWGPEIARTQFNPPHIYLLLFLVGLPGQLLFGVTTMTMSAVLTTYLFGVVYFWATGSYFFIDSYIPIAVFLGMHLLFTDPSTSPRTELGRILFGVLYGIGNIVLYEWLNSAGVPSFYDKLLPVPIMNLSVRFIDRLVQTSWLGRLDPARIAPLVTGRRRNLAYVGIWILVFAGMSRVQAVGDAHEGHTVPFWQQACQKDARNACENLALILDTYCRDGSGWACNEVGVLRWHRRAAGFEHIASDFSAGCERGFPASCQNVFGLKSDSPPIQARPALNDYPVVLRTGKGALPDTTALQLRTRACDQRWMVGCEEAGLMYLTGSDGVERDAMRAAKMFEQACDGGLGTSCSNLGLMLYRGDGVPEDRARAIRLLERSCELGFANGCRWLKDVKR